MRGAGPAQPHHVSGLVPRRHHRPNHHRYRRHHHCHCRYRHGLCRRPHGLPHCISYDVNTI